MSGRMNWRYARLAPKRALALRDEQEFRENDRASRFLSRADDFAKKKLTKKRGAA